MQHAHGEFKILLVDDDRDLDFGSRDHLQVDAFFGEAAEHLAGDARVRAHADADGGDLADLVVADDLARADVALDALKDAQRLVEFAAVHREGEIGGAVMADVLDDHVDVDVGVGDRAEDLVGDARTIGDAENGELGFVAVEGDAGDDRLFHGLVFLNSDQRAFAFVGEAGEHAQFDLVLAGEFDRADLQHLGAEAGHFQHLLEGNGVELLRFRHDARVGGVHTIDVGVDLALVGLQRRSERDGGGVRAATAECRDVAVLVGALEARNDNDIAVREVLADFLVVDVEDACLGEGAVGQHAHLRAGIALRLAAFLHDRHRQEADGDLFAGGGDDIQLARIR